ncbi:MAG: sterol desaturase family protein, partial [Methylotenera sp.]
MALFNLEQSKALYRADIALYSIATLALAAFLLITSPRQQWLQTIAFMLLGIASWTVIEYALHRFILHSLQPFIRWHAMHHRRPKALIFAPTILSATLIAMLIFLPALLLGGLWHACALTLGFIMGYLFYTITHHAIHHWHANNNWLKERKHCHALHHHYNELYGCYGVTSAFWDRVFGSYYQTSNSQPKS